MRKRKLPTSKAEWNVVVENATRYEASYWSSSPTADIRPVKGQFSVFLSYPGGKRVHVGSVSVTSPDFDERIAELRALAQERASTLNAIGATP